MKLYITTEIEKIIIDLDDKESFESLSSQPVKYNYIWVNIIK